MKILVISINQAEAIETTYKVDYFLLTPKVDEAFIVLEMFLRKYF